MIHVLAGPDHLAAVAPLAAEAGPRAWRTGLRWGLGHALGALAVGALVLLFRRVIPLELVAGHGERLVGLALVGIGLCALRRALSGRLHAHEHEHDGHRHTHLHIHLRGGAGSHSHPAAHAHEHAALVIGVLHGVAGSSHLVGVLPALALPSLAASVVYLSGFAMGTVAGMLTFAALAGLIAERLVAAAGDRAYGILLGGLAAVAGGVGAFWLLG